MTTSTLSSKYQVVVPKEVRQALHIQSGDKIVYVPLDDGSFAIKRQPTVYDLIGSVPNGDGDAVERLRRWRDMDD